MPNAEFASLKAIRQTALVELACVSGALIVACAIIYWAASQSLQDARRAALVSELSTLRAHGARGAARIENYLVEDSQRTLQHLRDAPWLADAAPSTAAGEASTYIAVIDNQGHILLHSLPALSGEYYDSRWYERALVEAGPDVVTTRNASLTGGDLSYDVATPILLRGEPIGSYHVGASARTIDHAVSARTGSAPRKWLVIGGALLLMLGIGGYAIVRQAIRTAVLTKAMNAERAQRLTELGRLAAMLAHEIRNPINAIRMNLYMIGRMVKNREQMESFDAENILRDSNAEIDRLERLIKSVLAYASPGDSRVETIDLSREIRSAVSFIRPLLDRSNVTVAVQAPDQLVEVDVDRDRLRQSLLNLINNAHEACPQGGHVDVAVERQRGWAVVSVRDNGPGIRPGERDRIFDPFYTTKKNGCGLGLAVVKRFAEESNGLATCNENGRKGAEFRIALPVRKTFENRKQRP